MEKVPDGTSVSIEELYCTERLRFQARWRAQRYLNERYPAIKTHTEEFFEELFRYICAQLPEGGWKAEIHRRIDQRRKGSVMIYYLMVIHWADRLYPFLPCELYLLTKLQAKNPLLGYEINRLCEAVGLAAADMKLYRAIAETNQQPLMAPVPRRPDFVLPPELQPHVSQEAD